MFIKLIDADHEIVTVLNKIDLPASEPERIKKQIDEVIGLPGEDAIEFLQNWGWNKISLSSLVENFLQRKN